MSFIILVCISSIVGGLLLRIGTKRLIILPIFFVIMYMIDRLQHLGIKKVKTGITIEHGIIISRYSIMIGLHILLQSYNSTIWRYTGAGLLGLNSILLILSYYTGYHEGKNVFFWGLLGTLAISIVTGTLEHTSTVRELMIFLTCGTIIIFTLLFISQQWISKNQKDDEQLQTRKEILFYLLLYLGCYRLLYQHTNEVIVLQLWTTTVFISLRQQFLGYQSQLQHEKTVGLTGRSLLQGQKVLKRYESKKDSVYSIMNQTIQRGIVPSYNGLRFLQIAQGIFVTMLIIRSIRGLRNQLPLTLLWYRLGIVCFIISIFVLDRQDKFFNRYKKLSLIILSSAFYLTLFYQTSINTTFVITSLGRNCINMISCLFYDTLIPLQKRILYRNDLIFWMLWTNGTSIITLLSLGTLSISGDIIFALGCIIIGIMSFFSYHIWRKYSSHYKQDI